MSYLLLGYGHVVQLQRHQHLNTTPNCYPCCSHCSQGSDHITTLQGLPRTCRRVLVLCISEACSALVTAKVQCTNCSSPHTHAHILWFCFLSPSFLCPSSAWQIPPFLQNSPRVSLPEEIFLSPRQNWCAHHLLLLTLTLCSLSVHLPPDWATLASSFIL